MAIPPTATGGGSFGIVNVKGRGEFLGMVVEVPGGERISVAFSRFADKVSDFSDFWKTRFAPQFFADVTENFETEGQPVGGWAPLSPGYAAWKAKKVGDQPILVRTGRLKDAFNPAGSPDQVLEVTADTVMMGTRLPYAAAHHFGNPAANLPQRRILWLRSSEVYGKLAQRWVGEQARASGLKTEGGAA